LASTERSKSGRPRNPAGCLGDKQAETRVPNAKVVPQSGPATRLIAWRLVPEWRGFLPWNAPPVECACVPVCSNERQAVPVSPSRLIQKAMSFMLFLARRRGFFLSFAVFFVAGLAGCSSSGPPTSDNPPGDPLPGEEAGPLAQAAAYSEARAGDALLVRQGGDLLLEEYTGSIEAGGPHMLTSGTKTLTGVMALTERDASFPDRRAWGRRSSRRSSGAGPRYRERARPAVRRVAQARRAGQQHRCRSGRVDTSRRPSGRCEKNEQARRPSRALVPQVGNGKPGTRRCGAPKWHQA